MMHACVSNELSGIRIWGSLSAKDWGKGTTQMNLPDLIAARSCHVPHPLDTAVLALLKHLEISDQ